MSLQQILSLFNPFPAPEYAFAGAELKEQDVSDKSEPAWKRLLQFRAGDEHQEDTPLVKSQKRRKERKGDLDKLIDDLTSLKNRLDTNKSQASRSLAEAEAAVVACKAEIADAEAMEKVILPALAEAKALQKQLSESE